MDEKIKRKIKNKVIFITGGTGSFGNTVADRLVGLSPKKIVIYSRDEKKQFDMRNRYGDNPLLRFIIGDVRDREKLIKVMDGVDYVFHAAALKQVPTGEFFPLEIVKTNILGAQNVIDAAIINNIKNVVVLSTDKAVYPINTVGISKAMMEKIMIAESKELIHRNGSKTILSGVRYGNVLFTRGSVIPYFLEIMKQGGQLPVTDRNMTRFLLPLQEAVNLVLFALINGEKGYIYVKKSPACTLETLAQSLCNIFEYKKGYREVGIRAGEKMHETLLTEEEMLRASDSGEYFKVPPESQGLDYERYFHKGSKPKKSEFRSFTSENTKRLDVEATTKLLKTLPEVKKLLKKTSERI